MSTYADGTYGDGSYGNAITTIVEGTYGTDTYGFGNYAALSTSSDTCQIGYIDIITSDWPFDAQDDQLAYPGTWYLYGSIDAQNSFTSRLLSPPFDVFQCYYDEGFRHGLWNKQFLTKTSM